jgi:hypothetical protein
MNMQLFLGAVLCTGASVFAQTGFAAPAFTNKEEGTYACNWLGRHPSMRHQVYEGDFRNKGFSIKEIAVRLDTRDHGPNDTEGRSWTQVTLQMAACDFAKITPAFNTNAIGGFTVVFRRKMDWPSQTGLPAPYNPTIWGDRSGKLRFPFANPWLHTGKLDLLTDFRFEGGLLANAVAWGAVSQFEYYLDADAMTTHSHQAVQMWVPRVNKCVDPANPPVLTGTIGANLGMSAFVFGDGFSDPNRRGMMDIGFMSVNVAPNAWVINAIGVAGNVKGVDVGALCNRLHLDLSKPYVPLFLKTTQKRGVGISPNIWGRVKWQNAFGGLEIWGQAAWSDSKTGGFSLSQAGRLILPARKPGTPLPRRMAALSVSANAGTADVKPTTVGKMIPVIFYRTK